MSQENLQILNWEEIELERVNDGIVMTGWMALTTICAANAASARRGIIFLEMPK